MYMAKKWMCLALVVGLGIGGFSIWQRGAVAGQQRPTEDERIAQLVQQLGSMKFAERDKAKRELEAIGLPALEHLRKAAKAGDLEVAMRCQEILKKLEAKVAADNLLAPKKVHLKLKDVSVIQALEELQKQSGYTIVVDGDRTALANRKVTLDTGSVPFLQAFDLLCEKGNLVEVANNNPYSMPPYYGNPGVRPPIKVQPLPKPGLPMPPPQPAPMPLPLKRGALPAQPAPMIVQVQVDLPIQVELPAVGGNAKAIDGQVRIAVPVQVGQPAQGGQGGAGGIGVQPGQPGQAGQGGAGAIGGQPGQPGQPGQAGGVGQAQPGKVAPGIQPKPVPVQPGGGIRPGGPIQPPGQYYPPGQIVVRDGTPEKFPTFYHGAVRIRLLPASKAQIPMQPQRDGEALFILEVTPEPRLQSFSVAGSPRVEKAVDELGQEMALVMEPMGNNAGQPIATGKIGYISPYNFNGVRQVALRLKVGEKQAKAITTLNGQLTVQGISPEAEPVIAIDDVLKSAGKTVKGQSGGMIQVMAIDKLDNGDYKVTIRFENPPQLIPGVPGVMPAPVGGGGFMPAAGVAQVQVQVQGQPAQVVGGPPSSGKQNAYGLPVLVDAKGKVLELVQIPQRGGRVVDGKYVQEITMVFRTANGATEPARIVLFGHRMITAQVPFQFENVRLP
jgi:hypothetical protein